MKDKVQKILNEISVRKLCTMDEHMAFYNDKAKEDYRFLSEIEELIKALQEEPVSDEQPSVILYGLTGSVGSPKEEPVSDELEKVVEEIVDPTVLNAYGVKEIANRLRKTMIEPVSEDLEDDNSFEELIQEIYVKYNKEISIEKLLDIASNFAKWQKEQILDCNTTLQRTFEIGKQEMKQQLMAKAVDAVVKVEAGNYPYIPQMELYDYDKDIPLAKEGDRYKVVLIKED